MPELPWEEDDGALTTATIFHDAVYCIEALGLADGQTEDTVDSELALLAQERGIQDPYRHLCPPDDHSRALSTATPDSDHRSSVSVHSQSTSFTSAPSRTSRDQIYTSERSPSHRVKLARASSTNDHSEQGMDTSTQGVKQRHSSSALSTSQSVLSSSSSSIGPAPRRKRGTGLFGMFRKDSR